LYNGVWVACAAFSQLCIFAESFFTFSIRWEWYNIQDGDTAGVTSRSFARGMTMANAFVHMELNTTDPAKAKAFYSKLFDWKLEDMPGPMPYTMIHPGEGPGGGMMKHPVPGAPSMWLTYIGVSDIKAATEKAKSLGATALQENHEVPNYGWFSILSDPTGAVFALWQAKM